MKQDDDIMRQLHRIREAHYNQTKDMSPKEILAFDSKKVSEIKRRYNLNLPRLQVTSSNNKRG